MRVAVIGLGFFSQFHLKAWTTLPHVSGVWATDLSSDRRAWAADTFDVQCGSDLESVLAADPKIVDIIAPPSAHAELIKACAAPGRILVCQKPFCTSFAQAEEATAHAEAAGARLAIHENFRFQPWHRTIKTQLADMGQIYQARFALRPGDGRGADAYLARQPAFQTMPRLLIHETAVHLIDLFRWFFGDVTAIYADIRRLNPVIAGEDAGLMILDHVSGTRSQFDGNRLMDHVTDSPRRTMGVMQIEAEAGTLSLDGQGRVWLRPFQAQSARQVPVSAPVDETSFGGGCAEALCAHVARAARGLGVLENQARAYLPVIAATDAAYRSAETGQKIQL